MVKNYRSVLVLDPGLRAVLHLQKLLLLDELPLAVDTIVQQGGTGSVISVTLVITGRGTGDTAFPSLVIHAATIRDDLEDADLVRHG